MTHDRPSRAELHALFVHLFTAHGTEAPRPHAAPVAETVLDDLEHQLGAVFPTAYKTFLRRYGPVATPKLSERLEALTWDGRTFGFERVFEPENLRSLNRGPWISTVPSHMTHLTQDTGQDVFRYLLAFTIDCALGERICFARCGVPNDDLPVFLFDHEGDQIVQLAPSFDDLLWSYIVHLGPDADGRVRASRIPPRDKLEFTVDNDHNPTYVQECDRCDGFGKLFTFKYDRPRVPEDDRPCTHCGATGWLEKRRFENENPPIEVAPGQDGWVTCPCCGVRFPPKRSGGWTGYRHMKCGQRIILRER